MLAVIFRGDARMILISAPKYCMVIFPVCWRLVSAVSMMFFRVIIDIAAEIARTRVKHKTIICNDRGRVLFFINNRLP
jgi:hypothetical protein